MIIEVHDHDDGDERLWCKLGRFFANSACRRELGGFVSSDASHTWWLALDKDDMVIAFCAARRRKNGKVVLTYSYVLPEHRGRGVYRTLFERRLADVAGWPDVTLLEAAVNSSSMPLFVAAGFKAVGKRGGFTVVQRSAAEEVLA